MKANPQEKMIREIIGEVFFGRAPKKPKSKRNPRSKCQR